ncbi:MAG: hypothetical protein LBC84_10060 [Prevotellaceae bacterium]|jgi:tetratricopeptide (TPR) repeat protein|nr:hypothetical protein [Prevotellaceae bacterium]
MRKLVLIVMCMLVSHLCTIAQSTNYKEQIQSIHDLVPESEIVGDTARTLAQAYEGLLKHREAYTYYSRWLSADSTNLDALNATARMALQLGRVDEGEELYLKAFSIDSTHFNSGLQLAKLNFQLKKYEKAQDYYLVLLLQDTTNISLLTSVGDCLYEMQSPFAIEFYREAFELNKENVSLAITLINTLLSFRDMGQEILTKHSLDVCDTALHYNPNNKALLRSKGVISYLMKDYHTCDSLMTGLIASGDSTMMNFRYVSLSKYEQNLFFDALPYMEHYYRFNDENIEAAMMLGVSLGRTYDRKRALLLFDHVESLIQPAEDMVYQLGLQRGIVYQANGERSKAIHHYWQAAQISQKNQRAILSRLIHLYAFTKNRFEVATPEDYSQGLFVYLTYLRKVNEGPIEKENENNIAYAKYVLSLYLEDMFFKEVTRLQMESPDGKKEWVTREELERLSK